MMEFDKPTAKALQESLNAAGFNAGTADGIWGKNSQAALEASYKQYGIAWSGNRNVSDEFVTKTAKIAKDLQQNDDGGWLMSCMAFETGRTFSPTIQNGAGASYWGLCQFGSMAMQDIGVTKAQLLAMTAVQQLDCVYKYFKPYTGKLYDLTSCYMRILWPVGVTKPNTYIMWDKNVPSQAKAYEQNRGLDVNKDGKITRAEVGATIWKMYGEGLLIKNRKKIA
ncbi:PgbD protein [Serratia phage vB_SmaS-Totoro]|nr:PgbD protein [Serratia phage vB_SmaS-Totoro]